MSTEDVGLKTPFRGRSVWRERQIRRRTSAYLKARFSAFMGLADGCAIISSALMAGLVYHSIVYGEFRLVASFVELSAFTALLFVICNVLRHEYEISSYLTFAGHAPRAFLVWNISFFTILFFIFITKNRADFSRGAVVLFYGVGLVAAVACRAVAVARIKSSARTGRIAAVRVVLVGSEREIHDFTSHYRPWLSGIDIVASFVLRGAETIHDDLALAGASARVLKPDDIYLLLPWSETEAIDACIEAFMKVPASIHLGPHQLLDRFTGVSVARVGNVFSLHLVPRPLTLVDVVAKRTIDLLVAIPLLILLAPPLALVAIAIKLDSDGPVFFCQRRYGFNQEHFRIVKFRSMRVREDDATLRQAVRDDPRVTRVGRFIRRFNIDELPQLLNVIRGQMSLVGPRPHALVHNQYYERSIGEYARRHNVKPGITGWAQVHGLRGEVTSEELMRQRTEHDLYYIDNWTLTLDIRILVMTLFSAKAYANAY